MYIYIYIYPNSIIFCSLTAIKVKNYPKARKNSITPRSRLATRRPRQPSRTATLAVHRTKTPNTNVNSSRRSAKKSSANRSTSHTANSTTKPSRRSLTPTTTTHRNCTNSRSCTALTVRKCRSHLDGFGARIRSAAKSTVWNTKNNGVPSAGGRKRARDSAIKIRNASPLIFFLFYC